LRISSPEINFFRQLIEKILRIIENIRYLCFFGKEWFK